MSRLLCALAVLSSSACPAAAGLKIYPQPGHRIAEVVPAPDWVLRKVTPAQFGALREWARWTVAHGRPVGKADRLEYYDRLYCEGKALAKGCEVQGVESLRLRVGAAVRPDGTRSISELFVERRMWRDGGPTFMPWGFILRSRFRIDLDGAVHYGSGAELTVEAQADLRKQLEFWTSRPPGSF